VEQLVFIEPSPTAYAQGTRLEDEAALNGLFTANLAQTPGVPLELPPHEHQRLQRVFTGCARALYQHTLSPLPLPLTMLRGQEAQEEDADAPDRGWGALAAHVDLREIPGDHYSALRAPHVETLARTLASLLEPPPHALQTLRDKAG
jgi:thioesterase domain-containing protein